MTAGAMVKAQRRLQESRLKVNHQGRRRLVPSFLPPLQVLRMAQFGSMPLVLFHFAKLLEASRMDHMVVDSVKGKGKIPCGMASRVGNDQDRGHEGGNPTIAGWGFAGYLTSGMNGGSLTINQKPSTINP
jgi:hypothetical protein